MGSYCISQLAERAGVAPSTLRYYERIGLLAPDRRGPNGYREYGEAAVERLAFIQQAKSIGFPLDEVAQLADVWFTGDCAPIQERLDRFLSDRIEHVSGRIAGDRALRSRLERLQAGLDPSTATGECEPGCGCDLDPPPTPTAPATGSTPATGGTGGSGGTAGSVREIAELLPGVAACSLNGTEVAERAARWQRLVAQAQRREHNGGGLQLTFATSTAIAAELGELCAAETHCCPGLRFTLEVSPEATVLAVTG